MISAEGVFRYVWIDYIRWSVHNITDLTGGTIIRRGSNENSITSCSNAKGLFTGCLYVNSILFCYRLSYM